MSRRLKDANGRVLAYADVRKARRRLAAAAGVPWNPLDDYEDETPAPIDADAWGATLDSLPASDAASVDAEIEQRMVERRRRTG